MTSFVIGDNYVHKDHLCDRCLAALERGGELDDDNMCQRCYERAWRDAFLDLIHVDIVTGEVGTLDLDKIPPAPVRGAKGSG